MLIARQQPGVGAPLRVTAVCDSADAPGDLVVVAANRSGNDYVVARTDMGQPGAKPAVGCIIAKLSSTRCVVQLEGEVKSVYSGLVPGKPLFVGLNSRPTHIPPSPAPGGQAYLQIVGVALAEDVLLLQVDKSMVVRTG